MIVDWRSLQWRLAWQLTAVFAAATLVVITSIGWQAWRAIPLLDARDLDWRIKEVVEAVKMGGDGRVLVDLPPELAQVFGAPDYRSIFVVRGPAGAVIAASPPEIGSLAASWPAAGSEPEFFRLHDFGPSGRDYGVVTRLRATSAGPLMISVGVAQRGEGFLHAVVREFIVEIAWIIPVVLGTTLFVAIAVVRRGLRPLGTASRMAAVIGLNDTNVRLPTDELPTELLPLVAAFNQALARLDDGIALLRRFTANAAHELRTPLAVLTTEIETLEMNGRLERVKQDLARMTRLVDQLLSVARLDNIALYVSGTVDLNLVAADVVAQMAPLAIAEGKSVALTPDTEPVPVKGNSHAIADALRNLVENAIGHTTAGTEVEVSVERTGRICVADRGPGVSPEDRERIFERFQRGRDTTRTGAGLGLAIVREIMHVHGGEVTVDARPQDGAVFSLVFAEHARQGR